MPRHENGVANCHAVSDSVSDAISALICHEARVVTGKYSVPERGSLQTSS